RIADETAAYAQQCATAALALLDKLEDQLSRFRSNSEIAQIAQLQPGESLRLAPPVYQCLAVAARMEAATEQAFCISGRGALPGQTPPRWTLRDHAIHCETGGLDFDLGAIGKGFALDQMADLLREWSCPAFLLVAGGSSILAGHAPAGTTGWSCGLGDDGAPERLLLQNASLSGSGLAVKGQHIWDVRTGGAAGRTRRAWAVCDTAAESDALSTAAMVLPPADLARQLAGQSAWVVILEEADGLRRVGDRPVPAFVA
ncbi:MAG TPA: FAD:protein FMN transferase, partial [Verrucomicrobiae bacterium]